MDIKQSIRRNFARRAESYDRHAGVQRLMARSLLARVQAELPRPRRILEIGCGTGYFTALLRRIHPEAELFALDLDAALIDQARRRLGADSKVSWLVADGEAVCGRGFDLIISNATFQWFTAPGATLKAYWQSLLPGGCLAFATLGPQTFHELDAALRQAAAAVNLAEAPEIPARRFSTLGNWESFLKLGGYSQLRLSREMLEAHFPNVPEFLKALKAMGAGNPRPRPFTPRLLNALVRAYDASFRQNGTIPVTYEIIWALARKE
ncbi:MAG: methyltransferase domain-containing protein [Deltaproteobacteria bacterium]|nr:MAG: methyltransferase domain-containing protein [Deltaproteobacteria bacterium]